MLLRPLWLPHGLPHRPSLIEWTPLAVSGEPCYLLTLPRCRPYNQIPSWDWCKIAEGMDTDGNLRAFKASRGGAGVVCQPTGTRLGPGLGHMPPRMAAPAPAPPLLGCELPPAWLPPA